MALPATKVKTRDAFGVTYAAPSDPALSIRFKTQYSNKSLAGVSLQNTLSEIIYNDNNSILIGANTVNDPVSVRIRISGALESRARIAEMLTDLASKLSTWESEDVFVGFTPTTSPGASS